MTDTAPLGPHLSNYEALLLRFLDETERGLDPCVPVSWAHYEQLMRSLIRKGLVGAYYFTGEGDSITEAGVDWVRSRWTFAARLPRSCADGCDRSPRRRG